MKPVLYTIPGRHDIGHCVTKVKFGNAYVIVKCKQHYDAMKRIQDALHAFLRGGQNNPTGLYYHLFEYVKKHPDNKFQVSVLKESESTYELLKLEQELLDAGRGDKNCLNNATQAYIPQYNDETKLYGWIPPHAVLNFRNWLKSRPKSKKK